MASSLRPLLLGIGWLISNIGAYELWTFLGLNPAQLGLIALVPLTIVWFIIYFKTKPKQSEEPQSEKPKDSPQSARTRPLSKAQLIAERAAHQLLTLIEYQKLDTRRTRSIHFGAKINKTQFQTGESVVFMVSFRGRLRHGFYFANIIGPDGKERSAWDVQTLPHPRNETWGNLNGEINHPYYEWRWVIPQDSPVGEYTAYVRVHDHYPWDLGTRARAWGLRSILHRPGAKLATPYRPVVDEKQIKFYIRNGAASLEKPST